MLDPYITRAAGIALVGSAGSTSVWISDGGRLGIMNGFTDLAAPIPPGFTAVDYADRPVLNQRFKKISAGYRYTCGQDYFSDNLRCWGQRGDWVTDLEPDYLAAVAVGKQHVCYQVSGRHGLLNLKLLCLVLCVHAEVFTSVLDLPDLQSTNVYMLCIMCEAHTQMHVATFAAAAASAAAADSRRI
jgi:hypothetical protein